MQSPLTSVLAELGTGQPAAGPWSLPTYYRSVTSEYWAARNSGALLDLSTSTKIELTGKDRAKFLHGLCTNEVKGLAAGRGCEAFFTNAQGKVLFYGRVFAEQESLWVDTIPGAAAPLIAQLDRYRITEKVEFADRSEDYSQIAVIGPFAERIVAATGSAVPELPELGHTEISLVGCNCRIIRTGQLAIPALELRVPARQAESVWRELWRCGESLGLQAVGAAAFDVLRIEAGLPLPTIDVDDSNLPQEIGRDRQAISFTKGCYLGQETIARIDAMGHVNRHLVGLELPNLRAVVPAGSAIVTQQRPVGRITSCAVSPSRNHVIALGYVRREYREPGTVLSITAASQTHRAVVAALPFH